ncbi:MAG: OmpA family protein [Planctomycetota bacterium]
MTKRRWFGVVLCAGALLAVTGCSTLQSGLRSLGIESRSAWLARRLQEENKQLATQKSELEARLASEQIEDREQATRLARYETELKSKEAKLAELERKVAAKATERKTGEKVKDERWDSLVEAFSGLGTPIVTSDGRPGIRLEGDILFASGKVNVNARAETLLERVAHKIRSLDRNVLVFIDGHTDSDPLKYTKALYGDLYGLGMARANSVARTMVKLGVPQGKLITRSFGADYPIANNKSTAGKKKNRRVDITFAFKDSVRISKAEGH